jgi:hypothetical protein
MNTDENPCFESLIKLTEITDRVRLRFRRAGLQPGRKTAKPDRL